MIYYVTRLSVLSFLQPRAVRKERGADIFSKLMFPLFKSLTQDRQDADLVFDSGWVHKSRDYIDDKVITF